MKAWQDGDLIENPITDYFGVPLNSMSSAYEIARSYYRNLVVPCFEGKIIDGPNFALEKESQIIDRKMICIIPRNLEQITRSEIDNLVMEKIFISVSLKTSGREISTYVLSNEIIPDAGSIIVDIHITLASLRKNIFARLDKAVNLNPSSPEYQEIQLDEISKFKHHLISFAHYDIGIQSSKILENFKVLDIKNIKDLKTTKIRDLLVL